MSGVWLAGLRNRLPKKQTNKKTSTAQLRCEHDNMMNERRMEPRTEQKRKTNTVAHSNYFYTAKSLPCTNFRARVTPFTCLLNKQIITTTSKRKFQNASTTLRIFCRPSPSESLHFEIVHV